ncbi:MAG: DUF5666 domain-containing protein [Gammaproteobacteria bacterium]|nr:DUF5666 domain-containing protein [Gammaproteobacteria bacterium]
MIHLYRVFIFLLITSVSACVSTQTNIAGGNDEDRDIGLGGTGMLANTGAGLGGTGIHGVITGFGSIFVNGVEIEYNNATPFTIDGTAATHQALQMGDVVEVLTSNTQQHTHARIINLRHEVIGKVESVSPETASFTVLGQTIIQALDTPLPQPGSNVAISGFRTNDKTIQATRVKPATHMKSLLRSRTELPFSQQTSRWLIQTYAEKNQITLTTGEQSTVLTQSPNTTATQSQIKILQLHKTKAGELVFDREVDMNSLPRGRQSIKPEAGTDRRIGPLHMNNRTSIPVMRR